MILFSTKRLQQTPHRSLDSTWALSRLSVMLVWALNMDGTLAFASLRTSGTEVASLSSSTRRNYRSSSNHEEATAAKGRGWWSSKALSRDDSNNNRAVDDYLEFLERRYHRLHDSETTSSGGEAKFSAWKWLKQGSSDMEESSTTTQQRQQDDALYVLGVAGLASQRLLQKHYHHIAASTAVTSPRSTVSPTNPKETAAAFIETTSRPTEEEDDSLLPAAASVLLVRLSPLARQIALHRKLLLRYQARQLRALTAAVAKAVASAPAAAASAILRLGGGRKNIGVTLTVMAALTFFLLRPLSEVLVAVRSA